MAKYWDKININMGGALRMRAKIATERNEDHIEALVLQASLVEIFLRIAITNQVGAKKRSHKKYWDGDAKFSQLVMYHELLGGKKDLIKDLARYNTIRNKIIHETVQYSSIHALILDAKLNYELGLTLMKRLMKFSGFKIPRDFDKPFNDLPEK